VRIQPVTYPTGARFYQEYMENEDRIILDGLSKLPNQEAHGKPRKPVDRSKAKAARKARKAQRRR